VAIAMLAAPLIAAPFAVRQNSAQTTTKPPAYVAPAADSQISGFAPWTHNINEFQMMSQSLESC
jgi:hypothetical protein